MLNDGFGHVRRCAKGSRTGWGFANLHSDFYAPACRWVGLASFAVILTLGEQFAKQQSANHLTMNAPMNPNKAALGKR